MMLKELQKKIIENAIIMTNGMKVVNLTSINLFFDDGSIVPKGNKEILDIFLPKPVIGNKKIINGGIEIEQVNFMPSELIYDKDFLDFIENENIYFIGSHITCLAYKHPRFIMTQIKYKDNGKKVGLANKFTTCGNIIDDNDNHTIIFK